MARFSRLPSYVSRRPVSLRARLLLRPLEERVVPTVYTVTNTSDSGTGSLRDAITAADADTSAPHTIDLTGVSGTITLASALPTITKDMTITGPGAGSLIITGYSFGVRVFLQATPNLTVSGLTLTGQVGGVGAGIDMSVANEHLIVTNSVLTGCSASGAGGAIYNLSGGSVTISRSTIQNSTSQGTAAGSAIRMNGASGPQPTLILTKCQLLNNRSAGSGGAISFNSAGVLSIDHSTIAGNSSAEYGGGMYFRGTSTSAVTINASTIANNTGMTGGGAGMFSTSIPLQITSSTITGNVALVIGGGIAVSGGGATVGLRNSIVSGNTAAAGPDISSVFTVATSYSAIGSTAGFNYTPGTGDLSAANSTPAALELLPLTARTGPNGTLLLVPFVYGGTATNAGDPTLHGTTDELGRTRPQDTSNGNTRPDIGAFERVPGSPDVSASGSAAPNFPAVTFPSPPTPAVYQFSVVYSDSVNIDTTTIDGNDVSVAVPSGVPAVSVSLVGYDATNPRAVVATYQFTAPGGGWSTADNGVYSVTMNANQVSDANGSVPAGPIGTLTVAIPHTLTVTNTGDTGAGSGTGGDLRYCITHANADGAAGTTDLINMAGVSGTIGLTSALPQITEAVTIIGPGAASLTVNRTAGAFRIFAVGAAAGQTVAMNGFTIAGGNSGPGAGIDVTSGNLSLNNMAVQGNSTTSTGGAIYIASNGTTMIANTVIQNNTAAGGAVIHNASTGTLSITNSQLLNNRSTSGGGSPVVPGATIFNAAGSLTLTGDTIQGNSGNGNGSAAVYNQAPSTVTTVITNTLIQGNAAGGAAFLNASSSPVTMINCQALNNVSTGNGGGLFNNSGNVTLTDDTIAGNSAGGGGGVYVASGSLTVTNTAIANNTAAGAGGGLFCSGDGTSSASVSVTNSSITGNVAKSPTGGGGGIYFASNLPNGGGGITSSTIANNTAVNGGGIGIANLNGGVILEFDTITGNTATNPNAIYGLGGGGIGLQSVTTTSGTTSGVELENTVVAGNASANGYADIAAANVTGGDVFAFWSAIGSTAGVALVTNSIPNIIGGNFLLGALGNYGGPALTVPLLAGSPLIDAGYVRDSFWVFITDERGVVRPQGAGFDIGAYERVANTLAAGATVSNITTLAAAANPTYQFTVTYADNVNINTASIDANDVTITPPAGVTAPTVSLVGVNSSNPHLVVATYQFTAPGGSWSLADAGTYTVNMVANQVTDANGSVPAGPLASFVVAPPQTFTVTSTADSGAGTLRAAITAANAVAVANLFSPVASVIVFGNSTAGGAVNFYDGTPHTITLASALPTVADNLTITGPGSGLLTITRNTGAFQLLPINDAGGAIAVNLSGLTLSGATTTANGGAISDTNAAALTLTDVTVKNNSSSGAGGGIYLATAGTAVTLTNCTLQANTSNSTTGGGAIDFAAGGVLNMTGSSIVANRSAGNGAGVYVANGTNSALTITQSTIANNSSAGSGGGVYVGAGANSDFTVTQSTVANNSAAAGGGGLWLPSGASVLIDRSTLSGNTANSGRGGGLYFAGTVGGQGFTIVNSTIANNRAATGGGIALGGGGGTAVVTNTTIAGNSATAAGGGIGNPITTAGTITMHNSIVSGNSAAGTGSDIGTNLFGTYTYSAVSVPSSLASGGHNVAPLNSTPAALHLQSLANNGGPTQTIAFGVGSPLLNAGDPSTTSTTDQRGVPRTIGPAPDIGAYEYQPITVAGVQVNDGSAQRSEVRSLTVTFSGPVSFAGGNVAAAFQLQHVQTGDTVNLAAAVSTNGAGQTVVTLTFLPTNVNGVDDTDPISGQNGGALSLADGRYQLTVLGTAVTDAALGWAFDGNGDGVPGGNYVTPTDTYSGTGLRLYRLFGDATGDGIVDLSDLTAFRSTLNAGTGNPAYLSYLDADNSGTVDLTDLTEFRNRFNHSVFG
jgi:hypothetical protein